MGIAKQMLWIERETLDFSIKGYIAKPEVTRASRSYISTMINGRYIRSIPLSQSILRAYHTLLPIGKYPIVVLDIKMDPILVDVNVHPTKLEVRFSKEKELFQLIEETIRERFRQLTLIPELQSKSIAREKTVQNTMDFEQKKAESVSDQTWNNMDTVRENIFDQEQAAVKTEPLTSKLFEKTEEQKNRHVYTEELPEEKLSETEMDSTEPKQQAQRVPMMYPIGQLHGTYIMAQNENGLYM